MTVKQLIEQLKQLPPASLVVLAVDGEGNSYSPIPEGGYSVGMYTPDSTWSGSFVNQLDLDDDPEEMAEYVGDDAVKAVVLWPTN